MITIRQIIPKKSALYQQTFLDNKDVYIGSRDVGHVRVETDSSVEDLHARIRRVGSAAKDIYTVESCEGAVTYMNGAILQVPMFLMSGSVIKTGDISFLVLLGHDKYKENSEFPDIQIH